MADSLREVRGNKLKHAEEIKGNKVREPDEGNQMRLARGSHIAGGGLVQSTRPESTLLHGAWSKDHDSLRFRRQHL